MSDELTTEERVAMCRRCERVAQAITLTNALIPSCGRKPPWEELAEDLPRCLAALDAAEGRAAGLEAELKRWRPMTVEEALEAFDQAEAVPVSEEEIERLVRFATDPAERLPNSEQAQLAVEVKRLEAENEKLRNDLDGLARRMKGIS